MKPVNIFGDLIGLSLAANQRSLESHSIDRCDRSWQLAVSRLSSASGTA